LSFFLIRRPPDSTLFPYTTLFDLTGRAGRHPLWVSRHGAGGFPSAAAPDFPAHAVASGRLGAAGPWSGGPSGRGRARHGPGRWSSVRGAGPAIRSLSGPVVPAHL